MVLTDCFCFFVFGFSARDSVMLRTTYKSPSSVHLFGFSIDDTTLFPCIPPSTDPTVIRTQIDLQGWSIESLSPNTTQVTLLEQSDPRGWSGKGSIPQVMLGTLAGIGEFAIKHGGPPVCTRLGGAKSLASRYDVESETFRFEYQPAKARRSASSSIATSFPSSPPLLMNLKSSGESGSDDSSLRSISTEGSKETVECEIRCDADQWSSSFAIVIDPPQQSISALKRHRLSPNGGGLWLTIEHDPALLKSNGKVVITVRRGAPMTSSKTYVTVNGSKIKVDIEDLPEAKVQLLKKQKRARPTRAPLDQPPGLTVRKNPVWTWLPHPRPRRVYPPPTPTRYHHPRHPHRCYRPAVLDQLHPRLQKWPCRFRNGTILRQRRHVWRLYPSLRHHHRYLKSACRQWKRLLMP